MFEPGVQLIAAPKALNPDEIADEDREFVAQAMALLPEGPFDDETWGKWTAEVKAATGRKGKGLFMPLRQAVTGRARGPEMADVMPLLQTKPRMDMPGADRKSVV